MAKVVEMEILEKIRLYLYSLGIYDNHKIGYLSFQDIVSEIALKIIRKNQRYIEKGDKVELDFVTKNIVRMGLIDVIRSQCYTENGKGSQNRKFQNTFTTYGIRLEDEEREASREQDENNRIKVLMSLGLPLDYVKVYMHIITNNNSYLDDDMNSVVVSNMTKGIVAWACKLLIEQNSIEVF